MKKRFAAFAGVGAFGFAVQMIVLTSLARSRWSGVAATAVAVESAVLTNFWLHERWTWRDRTIRHVGLARRLWRFHAANGILSIVGNVGITVLVARTIDCPLIAANLVAIATLAGVNYAVADRWVFAGADGASSGRFRPLARSGTTHRFDDDPRRFESATHARGD